MALSNRDRVGQMFELLAPSLDEFITGALAPELKGSADWTALVALKDAKNGIAGKKYSTTDPSLQLRMLTENIPHAVKPGWYPFDALSQVHKSYASELRDARNKWAHNDPFTDDDAYRVLDTAERLLAAIGAPEPVEAINRLRLNLRRVTADKDDKKTLKALVVNPESAGLLPWREVLPPNADVATGNFKAAEFAADLYKVATSIEADSGYADPASFFARTYLTEGLRDLIGRAVRRLGGDDNASPVINLQTNFGGGKTHSMLSLWHLASGTTLTKFPQEVQELLDECGYGDIPATVRRVAIVGNHTLSPSGSAPKSDGTVVNTIWGELAWQLGGPAGYAIVAKADQASTPPAEALHTLLKTYAPAVILIDEWVAYARSLFGRTDLPGGTFDDQFTFAQSLTEVVKGTSGVLLAISIPASESGDDSQPVAGNAEEVGGAHGLEALKRLQNVVRRVADPWRPASSDEAFHIVRQRLFTTPDAAALASIGATAKAFVELYRKHEADFPKEARDTAYEERIRRMYPIHPELFDRLYEDWSSLERFQRTRGVLRLMNTVIHALWVGEDASPLIMPGSIPLATANVNGEITQYLPDQWKAIIDADVDGPNSEPGKIDKANLTFGQRSLAKRLARTVFFGAAPTIGSAHKGIETQRVFLGTATPGDVPGNFHSALTALSDRATYFYSGQGKYWFDLQANISRRAKDQAERLHVEEVWAEIANRLATQAKTKADFAGVHVCPEDTGDIPDVDEARLVILHPRVTHKRNATDSTAMEFAQKAIENRGTSARAHRNMVVFLAADADRMAELEAAVREYLGWTHVLANSDDLDLTQNQKNQAADKKRVADETAAARLLGTYHWTLIPDQPDAGAPFGIRAAKHEGQSPWLAERVSKKLGSDGQLNTLQSPYSIRIVLDNRVPALWSGGHVSVGQLWKVYAAYPYMPRLRDRKVLDAGLTAEVLLWDVEGFAFAESYDEATGRYAGLVIPGDKTTVQPTDLLLIVKPEAARTQRDADLVAAGKDPASADELRDPTGPLVQFVQTAPGVFTPKIATTRFFGSKVLDPDRYALDFKKVADEVLAHLAAAPGVQLAVRIEVEATTAQGFDENKVRTIAENAKTLKFDQSGFEER
jgi:hypothetical protein